MKPVYIVYIVFLTLFVSCSAALRVVSDVNSALDFSKYHTYNFYNIENPDDASDLPAIINPLNQRRIKNAIQEEMELRGYVLDEEPDILVNFFLRVENRSDFITTSYNFGRPYYGGYGYYGYYGGYGYGWTEIDAYDYKVGTLVIDLVDRQKNELMWYGAGTKALIENREHIEQEINDAVTKIFYQYNYLAGQSNPVDHKQLKDND